MPEEVMEWPKLFLFDYTNAFLPLIYLLRNDSQLTENRPLQLHLAYKIKNKHIVLNSYHGVKTKKHNLSLFVR